MIVSKFLVFTFNGTTLTHFIEGLIAQNQMTTSQMKASKFSEYAVPQFFLRLVFNVYDLYHVFKIMD